MRCPVCRVFVVLLTIASLTPAKSAIARPVAHPPLTGTLPFQRLSRDLVPSASEEFFRQGRVQFERELQRIAQNRDLTSEDLLQVLPESRLSPESLEQPPEPKIQPKKR
ncbi:MAG: hypothetical protein NW220_07320 [Leptolyngbyaceae cyanobacterium bins.349]|nr:hypothetical protein [Leptolyngbyaceae cyanobacterium bins.349]